MLTKKSTFLFSIVGASLILDGLAHIVFSDWFHKASYSQDILSSLVQIFIGGSLLLQLNYSRFLGIIYCGLFFLSTVDSFFSSKFNLTSYRLLNIYYFAYTVACTTILIFVRSKNKASWAKSEFSAYQREKTDSTALSESTNSEYYRRIFEKFQRGSSPISWNWAAFFFSLFWQVFRRLWIKMALYLGVVSFLGFWISFLHVSFLNIFFWFATSVFYGVISNYDYYLLKVHQESLWPWLTCQKYTKKVWMAIAILFSLSIASNMWYYTSSTSGWSYPYRIRSLGANQFQIALNKGPQFKISLPEDWRFNRFLSKYPWLTINAPGVEGLGLSLYNLPEEFQVKFDQRQASDLVRRKISESSLINRWIFSAAEWSCSPAEKLGKLQWSFCGFRDSQTGSISYHVVFAAIERQLVIVSYPKPVPTDTETFKRNLELLFSSVQVSG
ncbi:MAG: hypothetical protein A3C35_01005 [Omnitrophica bacterium RIFCSPHIGHO2_02_FULL_46_11]|nr:MAG: hypothetical protein A3C35_01005 [Omnitrophica bacterium RIFCSPHIGHO2_02_FULL_46_11]